MTIYAPQDRGPSQTRTSFTGPKRESRAPAVGVQSLVGPQLLLLRI